MNFRKYVFAVGLLIVLFFFQIPNVYAQESLKYQYDMYEFSIVPPSNWGIYEYPVSFIDMVSLVEFDDDSNNLNSLIDIKLFKNVKDLDTIQGASSYFQYLSNTLDEECKNVTQEIQGYLCSDLSIKETKSLSINGNDAYQVTYTSTEIYPDLTYTVVNIITDIPIDSDVWTIASSTVIDYYDGYSEVIRDSINSFKVLKLKTISESSETKGTVLGSPLPHWKSPQTNQGISLSDFLVFNTFTDLSARPTNILSPTQFTPQWYVNEENDFAIKFSKVIGENWKIEENIDENTIAMFTSLDTGAKLRISYEHNPELSEYLYGLADPKFFSFLLGENKADLYKKMENIIFKNFRSSVGETVVDSVGVTKFSDGLVLYADFFEKHESDVGRTKIVLNDISLLVLRDGSVYEILYYGDSYSALSYSDIAFLVESVYLGDVSQFEYSSVVESYYGIYHNEEFGFSYLPPEGWVHESIDITFLEALTMIRFYPELYDGFIAPTISITVDDLGNLINIKDPDHKIFTDYEGILQGGTDLAGIEFEIISKKIERYDDHVKITIVDLTTLSPDDTPIYLKTETVSWIYNSGEAYALVLLTSPEDFEKNIETFRQTVDSFKVGPIEAVDPYSQEKEHTIPDWIRNNAEWWAQGAIGDSDFVSGIQYLIKEGIMQIPETEQTGTASGTEEIPSWIKNNADWWAQGLISDDDFVTGIQYLVQQGIIVV